MKNLLWAAGFFAASLAPAADEALPPARGTAAPRPAAQPVVPTAEQRQAIENKLAELAAAITALKQAGADDDLIVDAEAPGWVVGNILRVPGGFISQDVLDRCLPLLADGLRRASEIKAGKAAWPQLRGRLNRAHRSSVDGTPQPYHINVPASYDPAKPIPLFVYLHGRSPHNPDLGHTWVGGNDQPGDAGRGNQAYIRVEPFGRGNNSFRWAGETDVFEAIASVRRRYNIDPERIVLAGFSMGGAGAWQIGLRVPDMFCGLEINAGVIGNRVSMDDLAPVARASTAPYGITIAHALAVANVPLVGFAGENDSQLAASVGIREQLGREGFTIPQTGPHVWRGTDINALFLVNPGAGHAHPTGETLRLRDAFTAANLARGRVVPDHVQFVTHTTRYPRSHWVTIDGLERHFDTARVDARRDAGKASYAVTTRNISRLQLADMMAARTVVIDGQRVDVTPAASIAFTRREGRWQVATGVESAGLRKQHKLQGPLGDAFFESFLCVRPTGAAPHAIVATHGRQELERFTAMFAREYTGEARTKADSAVTAADIENHNLILFGDPASNQVLARIADRLPIRWTRDSIQVGTKMYSSAEHVPVLIYPNPLNPKRYVVINSGLPPQGRGAQPWGDFAVLKITPSADGTVTTQSVEEGVFDESWRLPPAAVAVR